MTPPDDPDLDAAWPDREALDRYDVPAAPAGFAARVAALAGAPAPALAPTPRWLNVAAIASITVIVALVARDRQLAAAGRRTAVARETIVLGGRGVAVLEPGGDITWQIAGDGEAAIDQAAGAVFYRVEHGGPFEVRTPLGIVTVTGTCFAVAVDATHAVVTVYEGGVELAHQLRVAPGESGELVAGAPPRLRTSTPIAQAPGELVQAKARIAALETKLREARRPKSYSVEAETSDGPLTSHPADPGRYASPSPETLRELADTCWIAYDRPGLDGDAAAILVDPELATDIGLRDAERDAANQAYAKLAERNLETLRRLYGELTGGDGATLSSAALEQEIRAKSPPDQELAARRRISRERAGLEPPPAANELPRRPVIERYLRLMIGLGDEAEAAVATAVGAERAHDLRISRGIGWHNWVSDYGGCKERR